MDFIIAFLVDYRHDRRAKPCFFSPIVVRRNGRPAIGHRSSLNDGLGSRRDVGVTWQGRLIISQIDCLICLNIGNEARYNDDAYTAGFVVRAMTALYHCVEPSTRCTCSLKSTKTEGALSRRFFSIIEISVFHQCALACVAPNLAFEKRFSGIDYIQMALCVIQQVDLIFPVRFFSAEISIYITRKKIEVVHEWSLRKRIKWIYL
ncbi:hypothetical protein CAPTEDRAFT_222647 [Capitella teleta]|uniref:Uncharacterized protein n=1 Tax=Capitella teleta TaxID=283909 RepID=R7V0U7_CAPTE|nr:hypothetical protein CAPTEDRAFT_222647 [Capitella teleta]|eukprot:ELU09316.1 hypothetical protein CAPTEDRAFT_222647 [Capitella teleta]